MQRGFSNKKEALRFIEGLSFRNLQKVTLTYKGKLWIVDWKE